MPNCLLPLAKFRVGYYRMVLITPHNIPNVLYWMEIRLPYRPKKCRMSLTYRCAVSEPETTSKLIRLSKDMAPQTKTSCCGPEGVRLSGQDPHAALHVFRYLCGCRQGIVGNKTSLKIMRP
ncbi:hypothetical protein TNCV_3890561 [Trichonephila clavipes]|nr:hypothetical protein TNCV_3890561 [Trichonephila clavipes]